ncbi:integrase core domain-containing protein [Aurantimonas sp. A3-2-R12]|uniref:integrase core domain-containing protein n=1 Tax=Aurantimonas sp. A3-2-R12 TaxID=3114362 RepID=UPI003FA4B9FC
MKYGRVYLHAWSGGLEARAGIGQWITLYRQRRPHSAFGGRTPHAAFHPTINQQRTDQQIPAVV